MLSKSSDLMKGKSNHVDDADFSSLLSAIILPVSCKMRMERKRCYAEENDTNHTWCIVVDYLMSIAVEKSCSFSMGTHWQLDDFHGCSAKKSGNEAQPFKEFE